MFANYNAGDVSVIVGTRSLSGFGETSVVSIERDEDAFIKQIGADGEVTRSKTNNRTGSLTITLQQMSESNDFLSNLAQTDELTGQGTFPVLVRDANGNTLAVADTAWIRKLPVSAFARDAGEREWIIDCADLVMFVGGSNA